jgi:dihydroorotate dehydrogenase
MQLVQLKGLMVSSSQTRPSSALHISITVLVSVMHPSYFILISQLLTANRAEQGGLSGAPLQALSLKVVRDLRKRLPAHVPIIGCGGISSGADVLAFARAGASCVQLYTVFSYDGAGACRRIKDEVTKELARRNTTWRAVVEQAVRENAAAPSESVGVQQLVRQAEKLHAVLDELAERMDEDTVSGLVPA